MAATARPAATTKPATTPADPRDDTAPESTDGVVLDPAQETSVRQRPEFRQASGSSRARVRLTLRPSDAGSALSATQRHCGSDCTTPSLLFVFLSHPSVPPAQLHRSIACNIFLFPSCNHLPFTLLSNCYQTRIAGLLLASSLLLLLPPLVAGERRGRGVSSVTRLVLCAAMAGRVRWLAGVVTVSFLIMAVSARFVVEKSSVRVLAPEHIRGHHDAAIGNFGVPDYGGTLTGVVLYPDKKATGCVEFDTKFKSKSRRPVILLLDRGECYFALKSWNAQRAGAAAVLIADNVDEQLLTMDSPEASPGTEYLDKINIPSALVNHAFGESLKKMMAQKEEVVVKLDWRESMPHPDERVEYELWTNSNDECGARCDEQVAFVRGFRGHAQLLERGGYARFTPHYITWYCPEAFRLTQQCKSQCINHGRYCAPDPEQDFGAGYEGKDVVVENLRQLCVHRVANESGHPWTWWDYVMDYKIRCSMKEKKYSKACAEDVVTALGLPLKKVLECMGDPKADADNAVLSKEQEDQIGTGSRGDVTILPTLVINNVQYRGKLERTAVLKAVCAGFKEGTEPRVCLSPDIETNECLRRNGGCWRDEATNVTACRDTYRGRVCECPVVNGVRYEGDGYTDCKAVGPGRCALNNGGCWSETREHQTFSACSETALTGCRCPPGFQGDGHKCQDLDECKEKLACTCPDCHCKNTWGNYECKCKGNQLYIRGEDVCIANNMSKLGWFITILAVSCVAGVGIAGYVFYKYRLRSYMDSEIMSIMSQYMPLDSQNNENQPLRQHDSEALRH